MKRTFKKSIATRIRYLRRNGWSVRRLADHFKVSVLWINRICAYEVTEIKGE